MDYNLVVPKLPEPQVNWKYGLNNYEQNIKVNPNTARPLSKYEGRSWAEWATETFGFSDQKELFKGCKYIQEFLIKHKKKPSKTELAIFYYNRYVEAGKKNTLPFLTEKWIAELLASY